MERHVATIGVLSRCVHVRNPGARLGELYNFVFEGGLVFVRDFHQVGRGLDEQAACLLHTSFLGFLHKMSRSAADNDGIIRGILFLVFDFTPRRKLEAHMFQSFLHEFVLFDHTDLQSNL